LVPEHLVLGRIGIAIFATILALAGAELAARAIYRDELRLDLDERNVLYEHDPLLGWFPRRGTTQPFTGSRTIIVTHNRDGFRDRDHDADAAKPAVLVLGDSYVWGYDVEQDRRFTDLLQRARPDLEIYNMGVSGYGTDQELLLLQRFVARYRPALVIAVYTNINDPEDNGAPVTNGGYAKPYYQLEDGALRLRGVPVPEGARLRWARHALMRHSYLARLIAARAFALPPPIEQELQGLRAAREDSRDLPALQALTIRLLLAIRDRVREAGAQFLVVLLGDAPEITPALDAAGCAWVSLHQVTVKNGLFNPETSFPTHGRHWNKEGHRRVAEVLLPHLARLLPPP